MKILITGAGGFLGRHLAKLLLQEGYCVTNFSRKSYSFLEEMNVPTIKGDLSNLKDVEKALINQDAVFHVASKVGMWGKYQDFYQTNVIGTKNIIQTCQKYSIKNLVYTSTPSVVFGREQLCGVDEQTPLPKNYLNDYAKTKSIAEQCILKANTPGVLNTVSLRPHLIFGPEDQNLIPTLVKAAKKRRLKIVGNGKNLVDVIYVENAAKAHLQAFNKMKLENGCSNNSIGGKAYFLGQEKPIYLWEFINTILKMHRIDPIKKKIPLFLAYYIGAFFEFIFKILNIFSKNPPMTRFIALQLGTSHYFSHQNAKTDFNYEPKISIEQALSKLEESL